MNHVEMTKKYIEDNHDLIVKRLTGQYGGLRPSKPNGKRDNGLIKYIWRMARFHAGHDTRLPVMCEYDLLDWIEEQTGDKLSLSERAEVTKAIDPTIDQIIVDLGENPMRGAMRWGRAMGML